jgi:hypothetical protein
MTCKNILNRKTCKLISCIYGNHLIDLMQIIMTKSFFIFYFFIDPYDIYGHILLNTFGLIYTFMIYYVVFIFLKVN